MAMIGDKSQLIRTWDKLKSYRLCDLPPKVIVTLEGITFTVAVIACLAAPWTPKNRDVRIIRFALLSSGAVCGASLLYRYRTPSKLEQEQKRLDSEREQVREEEEISRRQLEVERLQLYRENELIEQRVQTWADEQIEAWQNQTNELLRQHQEQWGLEREMLIGELNQVKTQLYEVTRIKTASVDSAVGWIAKRVQDTLRDDFGLLTSCETEPMETGSHFLIWLQPRGEKPTLKRLRELAEELPLRIKEIKAVPSIKPDHDNGAIGIEIPKQPAKSQKADLVPLYDWENAKDEAAGFIVAGNTGSAKSTVSLWLLGLLTEDEAKQVVVLDVHAQKNHWHEFDLPIVYEQNKVILALELILGELNRRKLTGDEYPQLVVVLDEIGALKRNCEDKEQRNWVNDALLLIGAEGRKFGISLIAINQSKNVDALGIDGQNRNNYFLVLLNAAARDYANWQWGKADERSEFVNRQSYSCLVSGCVSTQVAFHPTHGDYKRYKIKGVKPKNLKPINFLKPEINALDRLVHSGSFVGSASVYEPSEPQNELRNRTDELPDREGFDGRTVSSLDHQPTSHNLLLELPPVVDEKTQIRVTECRAKGMNQAQTIESVWGVKKGGSRNWRLCRDVYNEILSKL